MPANRFYSAMIMALLALLGYLSYRIFQPFLTAIAWAVVFCVIFYPVYAFILKVLKLKAVASSMTVILIIVVIAGPFSYISIALVNEVSDFVSRTSAGDSESAQALLKDPRIASIIERVKPYLGIEGRPEEIILENTRKFGRAIVAQLSTGVTNILSFTANFLFMLFASFFFLKDGPDFLIRIKDYLPFSSQHRDRLTGQIKDMIVSTIYGGVVVAIVQGSLGGIAFAALNLGSPVLLGSAIALSSFIPLFGTAIVWIPASVFLFIQGAYVKGVVLVLIGIFVISMVDNILKPLIIGGRTKMPTVIIFFTVLGGIKLFGLLGLIMGPLVFALFLSVFEIFRTIEGGTDA